MHNAARDLACPELWADSLARSRARRQQGANRVDLVPGRKGLAIASAVAASSLPVATAVASGGLLQRGDDGGRVRGVQHRLGLGGDGIFGPHTAHAVRAFQKRNGLTPDGVVGPATLAKLRGGKGASAGGGRGRGPSVARLQRAIGVPADGVFGPRTARAVKRYQSRNGLAADGIVGPATWSELGVSGPTPMLKRAHLGGSSAGGFSSGKLSAIVSGADRIAGAPYRFGGGHGSFSDSGYDCSGSVSYALHNAGLLSSPRDSSGFESFGRPGPGKHVTIYANPGHVFMVVNGRRFDTSARWQTGSRWTSTMRPTAGYVARHPAGL